MKIDLHRIKIRVALAGFQDNAEHGVVAYNGELDVRPKYQREFVYSGKQRDEVIRTVRQNFPLNVMYWMVRGDGGYEVLDGQQRTISIGQYINGDFSVDDLFFHNLTAEEQEAILEYELMIYFCEGTDSERLKWFEVINIAGEKLTPQEIRNAVYTGTWLSDAKLKFSKSNCVAYLLASDGGQLVAGAPLRQEILEKALSWINKGEIRDYMARHQHDKNADELWRYFQDVIAWARRIFPNYRGEMKNVPWGELYNEHKDDDLNADELEREVSRLMQDDDVTSKSGIYSYLLTGHEKYLSVRSFSDRMKREAYERQKGDCVARGAVCGGKHWEIGEMEADHITPWSEGGKTVSENCQMICKEDNRRKSDR
ncbi:MAG: DUF262 domain-containing protein [Candidatus Nomurabacteria bacterium]|nr:MAG: DUF262 domain-containing protein [Candidatus Nomurabacteria bacterium]